MKKENKSPMNDKGKTHGYWEGYYHNGNLYYRGMFNNDKKIGYWETGVSTNTKIAIKQYHII